LILLGNIAFLPYLGQVTENRNEIISVVPPKGTKASKVGNITSRYR